MARTESNGHNPSPKFEDLFIDKEHDEVSSSAEPVSDAWQGIDAESDVQPDSNGTRKQPPVQWEIQTEGEAYIESLEKRLKTVKSPPASNGRDSRESTNDTPIIHLPANLHEDSDSEDGYGVADPIQEDVAPVIASETTCLLYDARQQQKEHERLMREERNEVAAQDVTTLSHSRERSSSVRSSLGRCSRRSSFDSIPAKRSIQPILEQTTPNQTVSSRIHFSDSVRISGGIKTKRDKRRISASSVFAPSNAYGTFETTSANATASTTNLDHSPPPAIISASSSSGRTPRGSFSRSSVHGPVSRAASFLSEDGTTTGRSRASTPASIYAPLLLPSKTAPSPSRHFYLTFRRDDGQVTYRELVRQQKARKKGGRRRGRTRRQRSFTSQPGLESESDSDDEEEEGFGHGWCFGLAFWTCGLNRLIGRWSSKSMRQEGDTKITQTDVESGGAGVEPDDDAASSSSSHVSGMNDDLSTSDLQENKSEMEVLFGSKPRRYIKVGYWLHRIREAWSRSRGEPNRDEEW